MVLNIQGNQTEPETTIGRFGLEKKNPTIGISLPEGLYDKVDTYLETETSTEPSVVSQTNKLFSKKPEPRPRKPVPNTRPKIRPGSVSPIDKIAELNYLLEGKRDPSSKKSQVLSGLNSLTETGQKAIKGFMDNAAGGKTNLDPVKDAWCAAFVAHVLSELGADPLKSKDRYDRLRADKYKDYGSKIENFADAKEGDLVVFDFDGDDKGDHVTFYAGDRITSQGGKNPYTGGEYINVVGGNHDRGEVSLRENNSAYVKSNVLAIRRITYNDIDFDFTQEMAKQDPVFKKFVPEYASLNPNDDNLPSFDEGGLAQDDQMGILGFSAQSVQQEVDKYVDKDAEPAKDITFKDAAKFVAELTPVIGDAMAAKEVYDELRKEEPNYLLAGALGGATIIGLIPGIGDAAASAIRAGAKRALDVGKRVEVDPDAVGMMGGSIRIRMTNKDADVKQAEKLLDDSDALDSWQKENKLPETQRQKNPESSKQAALDLRDGKITSKEAREIIKESIPTSKLYTAETMPFMPTVTEIVGSIGKKAKKFGILGVKNFKLKAGELVSSRLDINAYDNYDTWVVSIHDGNVDAGKVLGYGQAIRLTGGIEFKSNVGLDAVDIARGKRLVKATGEDAIDKKTGEVAKQGKATVARIFGKYADEDPYELQERARKILADGDPEWTQVGMNPYRGSAFYDKATGKPVFDADEIIQVGPLVLAKNVKTPTISDMKQMAMRTRDGKLRMFNEGGTAMKDQMEMAFMQQGGIKDDGMTKDPVSGNPIPPGSMASEVRDDIPAMLSEGEYVVPADVLRFYGVNFFEGLRNQAKSGLQNMESNGRIGGDPMSPQQVQQNMSGQPMAGSPPAQPVAANDGPFMGQPVENKFQPSGFTTVGGSLYSGNQQPTNAQSITTFKTFINPEKNDTRVIEYLNGNLKNSSDAQYTQPPYYEYGSAGLKQAQKNITTSTGSGGGGGGGGDDKDPPDPNAWAKDITNPEAWAEENLQGDANNVINTVKLGTSVARVNAMAELAKAQGNTDLYNSLKGKADDFVAANPVLNSLPNAWIDGDQIAANLQKDKDLVNSIFSVKEKEENIKNLPSQTLGEFGKSTTREAKNVKASKNISDKRKGSGMGKSTVKSTRDGPTGTRTYTEGAKVEKAGTSTAAEVKAMKDKIVDSGGTWNVGGRNKGGLMQRKKKKGK